MVTLYGDKTLADLESWPSTDQPPWTKLYSLTDDIPQGTRFEEDAWLVDGPIYVVCFTATDQDVFKSDVLGPIEVVKPELEQPMFTITFNGSKCAYDGPEELPAGQPITMRIDVEDQTKFERYGASVITMEEGKGLSDLKALPATDEPPYVEMYGGMSDVMAGSSRESTIEIMDGPVYIECLTQPPWKRVDALGPIAVVESK